LICLEKCSEGPAVKINEKAFKHCTPDNAENAIKEELKK
jgi:NADH:ubiquinone oxidoreductase subunit E